ncbi:PEP-CTERM sorting domain-containing protein [Aquincola sp. S2]|uniref:PEP-CTERM sorting domain-containing protein n=1 Tax=Pseudaquabacterium terrae TaxID=2732868 RepID=A0ABX2ENA2_9BURK|nr:PEP-CTERM sorting domain-containing protein [Aquabacterium terrae]NRF70049.1 PEP-CTERM sorting domain-containing protein [Aquabacterium terrae]
MKAHPVRHVMALLVTCCAAGSAPAVPIGVMDQDGGFVDLVSVGLISGADVLGVRSVAQGTPIGAASPQEVLANKNYTALIGQLGNAQDRHESYVELPGLLGKQMSSALVNAAGDMEVGVDGFNRGVGRALSRFALTVKNHRSRPVQLDFAFNILAGEVLVYDSNGYPADHPRAAEAEVFARIDAVLSTPAGPHGGHYDVTEHRLFDFYVGMFGAGPGHDLQYTDNAHALLSERDQPPGQSIWGYDIAAYAGLVAMPEIAPYGEVTLYYDMLARVRGSFENGGRAALGDPFDLLAGGGGIRLIERSIGAVPEPGTAALVTAALLLLTWLQRRRRP